MASKTITKSGATFYTIYVSASVSDSSSSSTCTVSWSSYIQFGYWWEWGVKLTTYVDGTSVKSVSGYTTSANAKCCSASGTYTYTKSTSSKSITVKATSASATVSGYGGVGSSYTGTASTTVTIPALASYTIKYNANGGSGAPSSQTKYYGKTLTLSTTKPTRTGYSFQGWGTSSSTSTVSYAAGASYTANSSATLYAVWKADTYTIKYNANGGSGAPSSQTKTYGVTLTLSSTKPTRTGYNFLGWATSSTATKATYSAGGSYTANAAATLYAVWEVAYIAPTITSSKVYRCDADGSSRDDGTYAYCVFSWTVDTTVTSGNAVSALEITCGGITGVNQGDTSGTSGTTYAIVGGEFSVDTKYTATFKVTDKTGGSTSTTKYLSKEYYAMYFSPKYHQAAFFGQDVQGNGDGYYIVQVNGRTMGEDSGDTGLIAKNASGLRCLYGIGSGGQNHGVHSRGYAPTADTFTADNVWEIYRNSSGQITVGDSSHSLAIPGGVQGSLTCTGSITASGHSTAIGSYVSSSGSSVSLSAATNKNLTSISVPAGMWIMIGSMEAEGVSGGNYIYLSVNNSSATGSSWGVRGYYGDKYLSRQNCSRPFSLSSTTTIYLVAQSLYATTVDNYRLYAIRIS